MEDDLDKIARYAEDAHKYELHTIVPRIVVGGICGAGKSSLLNAIIGKYAFKVGPSEPVTRDYDEEHIKNGDAPICFIDSPGFSEADKKDQNYAGRIRALVIEKAHLFILVIGAPNRALEVESQWLRTARSEAFFSHVPGLIAVNKIDMLQPARDWKPAQLDLTHPTTQKERNISEYVAYISKLDEFRPFATSNHLIPVAAGEAYNDPDQYNIQALRTKIFELLPDAAKIEFAREAHLAQLAAETIINRYAIAVGAEVCFNFIGMFSDAGVIVPLQTAMIIHIGKIYGQNINWTFAWSLAGTFATTLIGKSVVAFIISISVPGLKNIIGPPIAYGLTVALGNAAAELFASNKANASQEELQNYAKRMDMGKYAKLMDEAKGKCPPPDDLKDKRNLD